MSLLIKGPNGKRVAVFHFPKTGGTWIRETLKQVSGLTVLASPCVEGKSRHLAIESWKGDPPDVSFTLVREPASWMESWWRFNQPQFPTWEPGHEHPCRWSDRVRAELGADCTDFQAYVAGVLKHEPDAINAMYEAGTVGIDHVFRMEEATSMMAAVCEAAGRPMEAEKLERMVPPQNVSRKAETPWTPGLRKDFEKATAVARRIYQKTTDEIEHPDPVDPLEAALGGEPERGNRPANRGGRRRRKR